MFRPLGDKVFVSGQILASDVAEYAARGVTIIVNNRPDGEEADQPSAAEIEAAARAAGLDYVHIPVSNALSDDKVAAMAEALDNAEGNALLFCKSGTRSAYLWALARARQGAEADELIFRAAQAGYDLRPILSWLKDEGGT